jgi:hypothetical protein
MGSPWQQPGALLSSVVVTARLDLTGSPVLADTLAAIKRGQATAVVGAVFTETPVLTEPIAADLDEHARGAGLDVVDTLIVTNSNSTTTAAPHSSPATTKTPGTSWALSCRPALPPRTS